MYNAPFSKTRVFPKISEQIGKRVLFLGFKTLIHNFFTTNGPIYNWKTFAPNCKFAKGPAILSVKTFPK